MTSLQERTSNGSPLFTKKVEAASADNSDGGCHYMFRNATSGKWLVTNSALAIQTNQGIIRSTEAASLPTEPGLSWEVYEIANAGWSTRIGMGCVEGGERNGVDEVVPPPLIAIAGEAGKHAMLMSEYSILQHRKVNGYPLYCTSYDGGVAYLYRYARSLSSLALSLRVGLRRFTR